MSREAEFAWRSVRVQVGRIRLEQDKRAAGARILKTLLVALNGGGINTLRRGAGVGSRG